MIKNYFQKILSFLRIRAKADGLEISDQVLRLVSFDRNAWKMEAVRLAPGVMENGKIKNAQAFDATLRALRSKMSSVKRKDQKINVSVALSAVNMYSQVFMLPLIEGGDLEKAIALNVQMVSPVDISHAYFGWQLLGRDEKSLRSEIAAAFVDKTIVDEMAQALYAAGFITVGVESRALALVRTLREQGTGVDKKKPYLLIDVDNSGIDFLIVREGKLYFEYANLWTDIADEKGQIFVTKFKEMLAASVRQVLNFYSQHWPEPLAGIILSTAALQSLVEEAIGASTTLPITPLALAMEQPIPSEWFVALGCGLRGLRADPKDKEINLSGSGAIDTFHDERFLDFLVVWRVLIPVVLGCLIVVLALADNFLGMTRTGLELSTASAQRGSESAETEMLEASSTVFNQSVALAANAEGQINRNYLMIAEINAAAAANGVTVSHISFQAPNAPILVAGSAPQETQIASFRDAIQKDPHFGVVNLPLLNIQGNGAAYTFSMTFPLASPGF